MKLRFLSRLAFICNLFFLLAVAVQTTGWLKGQLITESAAIIGYFMALFINPFVNLFYLVIRAGGRKPAPPVPLWLLVANAVFLCLQIIFILLLNDQKPYKL